MRAVAASGLLLDELATEGVGSTAVELAERKTVVLPFGNRAVALT